MKMEADTVMGAASKREEHIKRFAWSDTKLESDHASFTGESPLTGISDDRIDSKTY